MNTPQLAGATALVAGGTGNVGYFAVDALLRAGAEVLVPSRDPAKIERLRSRLAPDLESRLLGLRGDIGTAAGAREIAAQVRDAGGLDAVVSTVTSWHQGPPVLAAGFDAFRSVIEAALYPHFTAAEALVPLLRPGGAYTTVNGPAGFVDQVGAQVGPIAAATAAQNRLVLAIADETGGDPRVNELVMWAYMGPNGTRPGSPLRGEAVGDVLAWLSSPAAKDVHGATVHLRQPDQAQRILDGQARQGDLG
ncbi:SDR family oxidoreductase [Glycomyces dulcitolivorans]|uniref:SDR family oxidoreductase n=1 Tax=Glycomyces dulcitolivorans TaxID=2200759 RepID=UPI000DD2C90D|nr:SDR family oxidoreductase [Glycomyces dulcitolivorans]